MKVLQTLRGAQRAVGRSLAAVVRDTSSGLLALSHNLLAMLGLLALALAMFTAGRDDVRRQAEDVALQWLQERHDEVGSDAGPEASGATTSVAAPGAADAESLSREQLSITRWIARRYRLAQEPVARLVREAWESGQRAGIEPTLILAIVAVESSFNPFAEGPVGAQGLMQVLTKVHIDKFQAFGGKLAAFDPISNLRVGVQVLKESVASAGNLHDGLLHYLGSAGPVDEAGFAARVMAEQARLRDVAAGRIPAATQPAASASPSRERDATAPAAPSPTTAPAEPAPALDGSSLALLDRAHLD